MTKPETSQKPHRPSKELVLAASEGLHVHSKGHWAMLHAKCLPANTEVNTSTLKAQKALNLSTLKTLKSPKAVKPSTLRTLETLKALKAPGCWYNLRRFEAKETGKSMQPYWNRVPLKGPLKGGYYTAYKGYYKGSIL